MKLLREDPHLFVTFYVTGGHDEAKKCWLELTKAHESGAQGTNSSSERTLPFLDLD